jgi:monoamine oxidase
LAEPKLNQKISGEIGSKIYYKTKVKALKSRQPMEVTILVGNQYLADKVVSTLPPNLLINTVTFEPDLPSEIVQLAKKTLGWVNP